MWGEVAVGLDRPKYAHNVGAAIRGISCFTDGGRLVWTGDRVVPEKMDRIPREERMKDYANVDFERVERITTEFPDFTPVVIELVPGAQALPHFKHPEKALYIFGPEDGSVNPGIRYAAHAFVQIPAKHCMNLSVAVNMILFHRMLQRYEETGDPNDLYGIDEERRGWVPNDFEKADTA